MSTVSTAELAISVDQQISQIQTSITDMHQHMHTSKIFVLFETIIYNKQHCTDHTLWVMYNQHITLQLYVTYIEIGTDYTIIQ